MHKDGDYTNNTATNLEYVTRRENQKRFVLRSGGYSVNLTKRVQTPAGMRYLPVAVAANGRMKPDIVVVDGHEERHPEGAYYLEWRERQARPTLCGKGCGRRECQATAQSGGTRRHAQGRCRNA